MEDSILEKFTRFARISLKFAKSCTNHPKVSHLFQKNKNSRTRRAPFFKETRSRNSRVQNGPVNFLTQLLNNNIKVKQARRPRVLARKI